MIFLKQFRRYVACKYPEYHKDMKRFYANCINGHDYGYSLFNYGNYFHVIILTIYSKTRQEMEITIRPKRIRKLEMANCNSSISMVADDIIDDRCIVYTKTKEHFIKDHDLVNKHARVEIYFNMSELFSGHTKF